MVPKCLTGRLAGRKILDNVHDTTLTAVSTSKILFVLTMRVTALISTSFGNASSVGSRVFLTIETSILRLKS
jgi:hypothetical protein